MKELLYKIVGIVAKIHNYILSLNDAYEYNFSDKQLHFLVIGIMGLGLIFAIYPVFKWLAKHNHVMVIAWIYVFTLIVVITFAIEIGQKITHTGQMEFADIMFGLVGFLAMFFIYKIPILVLVVLPNSMFSIKRLVVLIRFRINPILVL